MDPGTLESLLVREVRKTHGISRRDLADRLGVARSTAGRRVDNLIDGGLLREIGLEERTEAGRPKRLLELRGEHGAFAGFDFDARHLVATLVDFAQEPVEEIRVALPRKPTRDGVLSLLRDTLSDFRGHPAGLPLFGCGIGVPGRVRQEERLAIGYPYIEDWENVDLGAELALSPDELHIENNTRTIALGEYWLAEGDPVENLACLSVRTGISAAVISGGHLLRGHHEMAGEIRGWLVPGEARGSAPVWLEDRATVRNIAPGETGARKAWAEFVSQCREGRKGALRRLDGIVAHHADAVARIVQLADPERVVLSGAFNEIGEIYLERLREASARLLDGHYFSPPPIDFVFRGNFTGAHGAAALAAENFRVG